MLSPKTQYNLANARSYFSEHLCVGDYYSENEQVNGKWLGTGAQMLGLSGAVEQEQFIALCENRNPQTGERLTLRNKTTRNDGEREVANRRVFYDFTLSPPKSVSVAALVVGDERITAAHASAVRTAMNELERYAAAQVHAGRNHCDRTTGNFIAALFQHDTSRALDPHLHTHCIVFNATHDFTEQIWKALQNYGMLSAQKFVENVYYHELAKELLRLGYSVVNNARGDFELAEISVKVRECFSKRHQEIDAKTAALLTSHSEKAEGNLADIREYIAHKDRGQKLPPLPKEQLRTFWRSQMSAADLTKAKQSASSTKGAKLVDVRHAVDWAEEHLFERRSVVSEHEIWRQALARGRGAQFSIAELKTETASRNYLRAEGGRISRTDVLQCEWRIVELARNGCGRYTTLTPSHMWQRDDLAPDQQRAFAQILSSRDFVALFRGGAGTGKSHVLRRVQNSLQQSGLASVVLAPQRQQVLDLNRDGLTNCQTVSEFLQRAALHKGSVVIVDEAGQISGKQMLALLSLTHESGSRVILSGDTRQHGPVQASDALRAIERYADIHPAELNTIRRQDPTRARTTNERDTIATYRRAVKAAAEGDMPESFRQLDEMGAVIESTSSEQRAVLVESFLELAQRGESALVVSQTRNEIRELNEGIRKGLRQLGKIGTDEHSLQTLEAVDLTNAQKADARFLPADAVVILRRSKGKIEQGKIVSMTHSGVVIESNARLHKVRVADLDRLTICQPRELSIASGDHLQIKANASTADGRKLANGEIVIVAGVREDGIIALADGRMIPRDFRQFTRGYAVTSYGSQGKTVEHVLFSDSATRAATNAEQWYVTISRGRKSIRIFTTDKAQLAANIQRSGHRELALDIFPHPARRNLRQQILRGLKRGHEFARRVCLDIRRRMNASTTRHKQRLSISQ